VWGRRRLVGLSALTAALLLSQGHHEVVRRQAVLAGFVAVEVLYRLAVQP